MQEYKVKILKVIQETPKVRLLQVENPLRFEFAAGQFFMVSLADHPTVKVARAYSASSSPACKDHIEIGFDKVGVLTTELFKCKESEYLIFKGPFGKFAFDEETEKNILLVGAGTGVTPLMSIVRCCKDKKINKSIKLVYSVKTPEEIIYKKEIEKENEDNGNFSSTVTVTQDHDEWGGRTGRIDKELLSKNISEASNTECYLCGPREFVFSMIKHLEELGVTKDQIKTDVWGE